VKGSGVKFRRERVITGVQRRIGGGTLGVVDSWERSSEIVDWFCPKQKATNLSGEACGPEPLLLQMDEKEEKEAGKKKEVRRPSKSFRYIQNRQD